jgi:outer membrane protein OmpA-like peptidoglycan-associated protein
MKRIVVALLAALCLGCDSQSIRGRETGALGGGALGAGLGAIIGHATGNTGAGIAIGAGLGAITGGVLGNESDRQADRSAAQSQALDEQQRQIEENQRLIEALKRSGTDVRETSRGVVINLPDVLFEFDRYTLTSEARRTTEDIARAISEVQSRDISVEGHTDSLGTAEYNQRLSESRARAVADQLVSSGVPRHDLSVRGKGERDPIASNSNEAGRQRNRRVEIIIENR